MMLIVFLAGWSFTLLPPSTQAEGESIFRSMNPEYVFQVAVLLDNGADYYEFAYVNDELGVCDLSRPENTRKCHVDLGGLAQQFKQITAVEYLPSLPVSIQWNDSASATPIALAAEIKEWDTAGNQARRWKLACSVMPDHPELATCLLVDRIYHFNYITVSTDQIMAVQP